MRKLTLATIAAAFSAVTIVVFGLPGSPATGAFDPDRPNGVEDPCRNVQTAKKLLCPDLRIARPSEMYLDRKVVPGRVVLRATNDIRSRGQGPMEIRGHRDHTFSMNVTQAIQRRAGGYALYPTQARLRFFTVGYRWGGSYWKVRDPLHFELWRIDEKRRRTKLVRTGPKQFYCFRDLERTNPSPRSPAAAVYPACNQNPKVRHVTLGTSIGWSDIYPSTYHLQWIDVTGLRGCFAYVLHLDPGNVLFELDKENNVSQRIVRLPWRGYRHRGC
ncbi:MAG: hypothetical protein KDB48_05535 [Solirubrobacterales bacterium]|nr:hypothetical protein [Solirubrobacterales bacterium]HMT04679.1 lysyl oxidase family protein [Solirubrobacterales bacterium]